MRWLTCYGGRLSPGRCVTLLQRGEPDVQTRAAAELLRFLVLDSVAGRALLRDGGALQAVERLLVGMVARKELDP